MKKILLFLIVYIVSTPALHAHGGGWGWGLGLGLGIPLAVGTAAAIAHENDEPRYIYVNQAPEYDQPDFYEDAEQ